MHTNRQSSVLRVLHGGWIDTSGILFVSGIGYQGETLFTSVARPANAFNSEAKNEIISRFTIIKRFYADGITYGNKLLPIRKNEGKHAI